MDSASGNMGVQTFLIKPNSLLCSIVSEAELLVYVSLYVFFSFPSASMRGDFTLWLFYVVLNVSSSCWAGRRRLRRPWSPARCCAAVISSPWELGDQSLPKETLFQPTRNSRKSCDRNGAGGLTQQLRVSPALTEDPSLFKSTSKLLAIPLPGDSEPSPGLCGHCTHVYNLTHIYS